MENSSTKIVWRIYGEVPHIVVQEVKNFIDGILADQNSPARVSNRFEALPSGECPLHTFWVEASFPESDKDVIDAFIHGVSMMA